LYSKTKNYKFNGLKEKSYNRDFKPYNFKGVKEYEDDTGWYTIVGMKDYWEIDMVGRTSHERLGYPTQKPETLLERIINASSNESDIVLDPFCGCGTALVAAQRLKRKWIGIDITHLALGIMKFRFAQAFHNLKYDVIGEPEDLAGATELANQNKYQFQWWAVSKIGGQPYGEKKKGADTGIDGYKYFTDEPNKVKKAIISVKGGGTSVKDVRDLVGVLKREDSPIGIFITLEKATTPMKKEAASHGLYKSAIGTTHEKIQILTIEDIFNGKKPDMPPPLPPIKTKYKPKQQKGKMDKLL
jgi:site-specific DNA-methyltransferase (adenine-specific)